MKTKLIAMGALIILVIAITASGQGLLLHPKPVFAEPTLILGHYYEVIVISTGIKWAAAERAARKLEHNTCEGYLATLTTDTEFTAVKNALSTGGSWLGGFQQKAKKGLAGERYNRTDVGGAGGGWQWIHGEGAFNAFANSNWGGLEPNDQGGSEDILQMRGGEDGWNDHKRKATSVNYLVEYDC